MIDKDRYVAVLADIQTTVERIERDLGILKPNAELSLRIKEICDMIYKLKSSTISVADFDYGKIVMIRPNEQGIYEIFQRQEKMKYFLDPQLAYGTYSAFYHQIQTKAIIFGKIVILEDQVIDDNHPNQYKFPKGFRYRSVYVEPVDS